jgi:cytochrome c oxidase subunit 7
MPIAPITGKLRKRLWLDLTTGAGLGTVFAFGYWFVVSLIELSGLSALYGPFSRSCLPFSAGITTISHLVRIDRLTFCPRGFR